MDDVAMLLKAIRLAPEEDTPRLMLADAIQEQFPGAADYIRDDIAFSHEPFSKGTKRHRKAIALDYLKWLHATLRVPEDGICCGGESWSEFHVRTGDKRSAHLMVSRGLPHKIEVELPLLMERAKELFTFPLTACRVTGRRPDIDETTRPRLYLWIPAVFPQVWNTWEDSDCQIPRPVFDLMPILTDPTTPWRGHYTSRAVAHNCLDAGAFAFGRAAVEVSEKVA